MLRHDKGNGYNRKSYFAVTVAAAAVAAIFFLSTSIILFIAIERSRIDHDRLLVPLLRQQEPDAKPISQPKLALPKVAFDCNNFGGPFSAAAVDEMVYWRNIPSDAAFQSPYTKGARDAGSSNDAVHKMDEELYFTFEPDEGGWNNIRMAMETAVALAVSMGRTLVLPPKMRLYLMWNGGSVEKDTMGFADIFPVDSINRESSAIKIISFQEFLEREAITGKIFDPETGRPSFPPENRTNWDGTVMNYAGTSSGGGKLLWEWVRKVTTTLTWDYDKCVVALPSRPGKEAADNMNKYLVEVLGQDQVKFANSGIQEMWRIRELRRDGFNGRPTPVNASATDRLAELLAHRSQLCIYDEKLQSTKVVHALGETKTGFRMIVHFYAFLFFEDWKQDVWIKRFIRDHFRYLDEIQCGAARIVEQVRQRALEHSNQATSRFDSFHIRHGEFQFNFSRMPAEQIYEENSHLVIPDGRTVYVATDERNLTFFEPLAQHYNLVFLDNFTEQIKSINPNYYGMLDQLVASRGDVFVGSFYSTFSGYINRMRGYQSQRLKLEGYEDGLIESYYYVPKELAQFRNIMRTCYGAVRQTFFQQEFHVAWRDLDHDVDGA